MKKFLVSDYMPFKNLDKGIVVNKHSSANEIEKIHTHEFIEMTYVFSGRGVHRINGVSFPVKRGNLLFINYNTTHSFEYTDGFTYCNILILPKFVSEELINSENAIDLLMISTFNNLFAELKSIKPLVHFRKEEIDEVEELIEKMLSEFEENEDDYRTNLKPMLMLLLKKVFWKMQSDDTVGSIESTSKLTPEIIEYIETNCFEKISLNDLAERCFYNPSYFSRMFKSCYGKTFSAFIQEQRIKKAQQLLTESDMSINKICSYVGYNDKTLFYKNFKKYSNNMLPNEYRKKFVMTDTSVEDTEK